MTNNPWFRMYHEFATDPKVQTMSEAMQRRLVMLLCLRCSDVLVTLRDDEIAFAMRVTGDELSVTKELFVRKHFIDDEWNLLNWDKRQYVSDSSTERTRRYRERLGTSQERHSDGTDTEQIQNRSDTEHKPLSPKSAAKPAPKNGAVSVALPVREWFEEFWGRYWRKVGKEPAFKAFAKRLKSEADWNVISVALHSQTAEMLARDPDKRPHAATWLNQGRMHDEPAPPPLAPAVPTNKIDRIFERLIAKAEEEEKKRAS